MGRLIAGAAVAPAPKAFGGHLKAKVRESLLVLAIHAHWIHSFSRTRLQVRNLFRFARPTAAGLQVGTMKKLLPILTMALLASPSLMKADVEDRLYDFTDAYYLENGVNPALIQGRMQPGPIAVIDTPIFSFQ